MPKMARVTGLEPAASGVTGRRSNQLSYTRFQKRERGISSHDPSRQRENCAVSQFSQRFFGLAQLFQI